MSMGAHRRPRRIAAGRPRAGRVSIAGSWPSWGPSLIIVAAAGLTYLTAFPGDFVSDAQAAIGKNWALRKSREWLAWFGRDFYWGSTLEDHTLYRPLTILSFVAHLRSTGLRTWPFILANVGLHAGVSLLVFRLGVRLVGPVAALIGALLFAVHPIHVEAVAWVMGRSELLAAGFGLAACLAAIRASDPGERRAEGFALGAVAAYLAASLSKEHAAGLLAWLLLPWLLRAVRTRTLRPPRAVIWLLGGSLFALALFLLLRAHVLTQVGPDDPVERARWVPLYNPMAGASAPARWLTATAVVWRYAALLVWPARLSHSYSYGELRVSEGVALPELAGLVLVMGIVLAIAVAACRAPGLALALALAPITFFPVSNFPFAIGTGMAERLLYFPSVGVCLAAGWGLARLGGSAVLAPWGARLSRAAGPARATATGAAPAARLWQGRVVAGAVVLSVVALGGRTLAAAHDWQSGYARMRADLTAGPRSATALAGLAWEENKRGNHAMAVELVERSLQIYPANSAAVGILGDVLLGRREPAAALVQYERAIELAPRHWPFRLYRGRALMEVGRLEEAERDFRAVLRIAPAEYEVHLFLGGLLLRTDRPGEARQHLELAARREPEKAVPFVGLGVAALQLGDQRAAARYGRDAERRGQRMPDSFWSALGGRPEEPPAPRAGVGR